MRQARHRGAQRGEANLGGRGVRQTLVASPLSWACYLPSKPKRDTSATSSSPKACPSSCTCLPPLSASEGGLAAVAAGGAEEVAEVAAAVAVASVEVEAVLAGPDPDTECVCGSRTGPDPKSVCGSRTGGTLSCVHSVRSWARSLAENSAEPSLQVSGGGGMS